MDRLTHLARYARPFVRRIAAACVIGLQLGVATSAVWEARAERRLGMHVEQDGTRHLDQHDEDTCAVCSVRTTASMRSAPADAAATAGRVAAVAFRPAPAAPAVRLATTLSRAPPGLPA